MSAVRYIFMFWLLMGLSITAQNQESWRIELTEEGPLLVKAVYVDSNGIKWFGTNRGLCRYDNLTCKYYTEEDFLVGNIVNALAFEMIDSGSYLWVATSQGVSGLAFDAEGVTGSTHYTKADGLLDNDVMDIAIDSYHGKFFGSESGVTWFHEENMDSLMYSEYPFSMVDAPIRQIEVFNDTLYLAADGGIGRFVSGVDGITGASRWTSEYGITPYSENILSVKVDSNSNQWFGTDVGVEQHSGYQAKQDWSIYSSSDGLVNNHVISINQDKDGGMWFGTVGGVSSFIDGAWTSYTTADGLPSDTVYDIDFEQDGSAWIATHRGAIKLENGAITEHYNSIPQRSVSTLDLIIFHNRANGSIHIAYVLEKSGPVSVRIYNTNGALMGQWSGLPSMIGEHRVEISLRGIPGLINEGIYMLQMRQGSRAGSRKLVILR